MTTLLVASTGGHLDELRRLRPRLVGVDDVVWATFDKPQARSVLAGEDVRFVPPVEPRDLRGLRGALGPERRILDEQKWTRVVSTGSGIALAFLPMAVRRGISTTFIESATRLDGPSLTGAFLQRVPGIELLCQSEHWCRPPWRYAGSILDGYEVEDVTPPGRLRRIVVTLGTIEGYPFRRALERLVTLLPHDAEVLWQVGGTDPSGLGIDTHQALPSDELAAAIGNADLVVAHAGVGSALTALDAGKVPVLLPREHAHHEHVDDHQSEIGRLLGHAGLAVSRRVDDLSLGDLHLAMSRRAHSTRVSAPPVALHAGRRRRRAHSHETSRIGR